MFETDNGAVSFDKLMQIIETVRFDDITGVTENDSPRNLFSPKINSAYEALHNPVMYDRTRRFEENLDKFKRGLIGEVWFKEAMSTSDFTQLSQNILMWRLLAEYIYAENIWEPMVDINDTIPDFRNIQVTQTYGLDAPMPKVGELANYQMDVMNAWDRQYKLAKYGRIFRISWEARMNDWLRMFDRAPKALARGCRNTENSLVTGFLAASAGPNPNLFSTDGSTNGWTVNGNTVAGVPNLTVGTAGNLTPDNLVSIYTAMTSRKLPNGNPQTVKPKFLVVPPALRWQAEKILEAATLIATNITTSGTNPGFLSNLNVAPKLGLVVMENRWLSNLDLSGNVDKTWYLIGDPAEGAAIEVGFMIGRRNPELFRQSPGQLALAGGGLANPDDGDWDTDAMGWKARHTMGGSPLDPRFAWAAVGA